ncbi:MAG: class II aldolase/adducin family protein [Thermaerobacter sp.]|nr:class II aldolase/adducin family protein [Thermaerobacter sp.]
MDFAFYGAPADSCIGDFADRLGQALSARGHQQTSAQPGTKLVFSHVDREKPRPFRRHAQATYIIALLRMPEEPSDFLLAAYPYLVRSLANLLLAVVGDPQHPRTYFLTLERGWYPIRAAFFAPEHAEEIADRLTPLATSQLIVDNIFDADLEEVLWGGDAATVQLRRAGETLDAWNLLPAPFPIQEMLPPEDFRHLQHLYQLGGLSYGNLSQRRDQKRFWMSGSGVNKARLEEVGRDILMVKDYDDGQRAMRLSVPPQVRPRRVSVDAIEHHMIYREHPQVGAIIHVHAWMDGIASTEVNYPCGTLQLATSVAALVSEAENPAQAVIGLKNHGMTITGHDLDDIMERVDGKIIPQVPMS